MKDLGKAQVVCVLGMHRSGTSLVSRILNLLGVYLGPEEHLIKPAVDNPKGFWEYQLITELNEEILTRLGGNWHQPPIFLQDWQYAAALSDLRQRARNLLYDYFEPAQIWGWKDPRTCLTLPFWQNLVSPVKYVICLRNPIDVARSLHDRDGFPLEKSMDLWIEYVTSALEHTVGERRIFLFYEDLMLEWSTELKRLAEFLGRTEAADEQDIRTRVADSISQELQHHATTMLETLDDPRVFFPAKALYAVLRLYRGFDFDVPVEQVLDVFSRSVRYVRAQFDREEQLKQLAAAERDRAVEEFAQVKVQCERLASELTQFQERLSERDQRIAELRVALVTAQRESDTKAEMLARIYDSHGWQALSTYYQLRNTIFPIGSRRRALARLAFNLAWTPRRFLRDLSFLNLQRFFRLCLAAPGAQLEEQINGQLSRAASVSKGSRATPAVLTSGFLHASTVWRLPTVRRYRIIYLIGCLEFESKRYRVFNLIEALSLAGIDADYAFETDIPEKSSYILLFDVIVLFRAGWTENLSILIAEAKQAGVPVVCDFDDYIFDRSVLPYVDGIRGWDATAIAQYELGLLSYGKTFDHCEYFTAPTLFLRERAVLRGKKAYVIVNTANTKQLQISTSVIQKRREQVSTKTIVIGYFSGTKTHQKDFAVAYPALLRILSELNHVFISLCGFLDLTDFPDLANFSARLSQVPFVHWERLPHQMTKVDINIIPLELGNPFCDAKSELKYFEAGLVKVPSVASPTETFKAVVRHGRNGLLASSSEEWYGCLKSLILDEGLRTKIAANAYKDAVENYTTRALTESARNAYEAIIRDNRRLRGFSEEAISVLFISVLPVKGSGGHKDIFLLANYLAEFGNRVVVAFIPDNNVGSVGELRNFIAAEFCEPKFDVCMGDDVFCCDVLIATHYSTAYIVRQNVHKAARIFYFIQDYEPYFNPMGEEFIKAERTYSFGFQHITLGNWLKEILDRKYGVQCDTIPFWIEKQIYYPREVPRKPKIAFLARPEMSRRCFTLGLEALRIFHSRRPDVEIVLFGSEHSKRFAIPFRHVDLSVLPKQKLAELYSEISLGIVFSTTNPSFVGYEMMACACPVVDLELDEAYNELKYGSRENAILVVPEAEMIANRIEETLEDEDRRRMIGNNALKFVRTFPDIEAAASRFEKILRDALGRDHDRSTGDRRISVQEVEPKDSDLTHCTVCGSLQRVERSEILKFYDRGRRLVLKCERCGFIFIFPLLQESANQKVEDRSEFNTAVDLQQQIEASRRVAELLETFIPGRGNCLEIGCRNAQLLKTLHARGWKNVVRVGLSGVDLRSSCRPLGIDVWQGRLEEIDLPLHSFDAIILLDVLQRVSAPKEFLLKLRDVLKTDGVLLIQVPDFGKLAAYKQANRERKLFCATHASCFTSESLGNLAKSAGWSMHASSRDNRRHYITAVLKS